MKAEIEVPPHGDFHNSGVPLSEGLQSGQICIAVALATCHYAEKESLGLPGSSVTSRGWANLYIK